MYANLLLETDSTNTKDKVLEKRENAEFCNHGVWAEHCPAHGHMEARAAHISWKWAKVSFPAGLGLRSGENQSMKLRLAPVVSADQE